MPVNGETLFVGVLPSKLDLANIKQIRNRGETGLGQRRRALRRIALHDLTDTDLVHHPSRH